MLDCCGNFVKRIDEQLVSNLMLSRAAVAQLLFTRTVIRAIRRFSCAKQQQRAHAAALLHLQKHSAAAASRMPLHAAAVPAEGICTVPHALLL
jgi:hypothetical protein